MAPEAFPGIYPATKAFVLTFSQAMQAELSGKGVYVQAVLPAATRTEIWQRGGMDVSVIPGVMAVEELVDAALVGFDRREPITIPPLPDEQQWRRLRGRLGSRCARTSGRSIRPRATGRDAPAERPGVCTGRTMLT